ncbi:Rhodanese-like protein [Hyaloscypha variabilis F]|uniref:Rhodanese-like protein n=1 Tax=Hyaloscypha variabilis (strain UAMH 11265 / GT02V1 / F) TaxID=1149755 RepID=A0A2J6RIG9_HYAVF|nr:Rhodanese-like protein [Hyaloscypha variabilis F]
MTEPAKPLEWWAALPAVRSTPPTISVDAVMTLFDDMDLTPTPRTFLLVDVRRTDWEGGTIKTSLNLPAQSFYQTRKTLFDLLERGGFKKVIFYCGSSNGRGPRCAGWMQDYIDDVAKFGRKSEVQVFTLAGGIKNWVKEFEGSLVDGFEEKYWEQFK